MSAQAVKPQARLEMLSTLATLHRAQTHRGDHEPATSLSFASAIRQAISPVTKRLPSSLLAQRTTDLERLTSTTTTAAEMMAMTSLLGRQMRHSLIHQPNAKGHAHIEPWDLDF